MSDVSVEIINRYLSDREMKVFTFPFGDGNDALETNVKVVVTGIKNYFSMGQERPYLEYTLYILPTNELSDAYISLLGDSYGRILTITTTSSEYSEIRWVTNLKVQDFIKIFGYDILSICTKVINNVKPKKNNKSIVGESILDNPTRTIVRDVITIFKTTKTGEFGLPEDLNNGEMVYDFPKIGDTFSIFLEMSQDENIEKFEIESELQTDEDEDMDYVIFLSIVTNPTSGNEILEELIGELNETISHELVHIRQFSDGREPLDEPVDNQEYYLQQHELEAQRKGFKRRSKLDRIGYEETIRNWFKKYPHKHKLNPEQIEYVIKRILSEK
jgi:hypothetical protein